jgi:hypothetical protein
MTTRWPYIVVRWDQGGMAMKFVLCVVMLVTLGFVASTAEADEVWWKWTQIFKYNKSTKESSYESWKRSDAYDTGRECRWSFPNHGETMSAYQPPGSDSKFAFVGDASFIDSPEFFFKITYKCLPSSQEP